MNQNSGKQEGIWWGLSSYEFQRIGADMVFAWPSSEIAVIGAESAVMILYRKEIEAADDKSGYEKKSGTIPR